MPVGKIILNTKRWLKSNQRYYTARLSKDLLGWWVVWADWGGVGTKLGNSKKTAFPTYEMAKASIDALAKKRTQRGYVLQE